MADEELDYMDAWSKHVAYGSYRDYLEDEYNFVEISRLPKNVNSVSR